MPLDPSIFAAFAPKPVSALDTLQGLTAMDEQRDQRADNALSRQFNQAKFAEYNRGTQRANSLQQLQQSLAGKQPGEVLQGLRSGGYFGEADAMEKAQLGNMETRAKIGKEVAETGRATAQEKKAFGEAQSDALKRFRTGLDFIDTPQGAARWLQQQYADPLLSDHMQMLGPVDQAITRIPQDPQGFEQWRQKAALGMDGWMKQQLETGKAGETAKHNRNTEANAAGMLGVARGRLAVERAKEGREAAAPKGVVVQGENGPLIVDPRSAAGKPVTVDGVAVGPKPKDMTEGQAKANLFGARMQEAARIIDGLAAKGFKSTLAQSLTGGRGMLGAAATAMAGPEQQQIDQAKRDYINAVLRRESGASIAEAEFESADKQYFPQPGDAAPVLAQKARARQLAIEGMLAEVPEGRRTKAPPPEDGLKPIQRKPVAKGAPTVVNFSDLK